MYGFDPSPEQARSSDAVQDINFEPLIVPHQLKSVDYVRG